MKYKLLSIFALAFMLRILTVFITTDILMTMKIFPEYYFSDTYKYHEGAGILLEKGDLFYSLPGEEFSQDHANYTRLTAIFYYLFGRNYKVMMFVDALMSALIIFIVFFLGRLLYDENTGLLASLIYAVFPSLIFWGSQHMRDSIIAFFNLLALLSVLLYLFKSKGNRAIIHAAVFAISLLLSGFLRSHMVALMVIPLIFASMVFLFRKQSALMVKSLACALIALIDKFIISKLTMTSAMVLTLIPKPALSLRSLADYVANYRFGFMQLSLGKDIPAQTLLYPYWKPSSVIDFIVMEAKLVFYVLFMPLPWLYSTGGRIAGLFSSIENLIFMILFFVGVYGFLQSLKKADKLMFVFIGIYLFSFISIYAFIAPDLGSAMRYKLQYVPVMLPIIAYGGMEVWKKLKWSI